MLSSYHLLFLFKPSKAMVFAECLCIGNRSDSAEHSLMLGTMFSALKNVCKCNNAVCPASASCYQYCKEVKNRLPTSVFKHSSVSVLKQIPCL